MRTQNLQKRVADLESLNMSTDGPHPIFGRCTDSELRQLKDIATRTKDGQCDLTPEEFDFLNGLEAEYGPL